MHLGTRLASSTVCQLIRPPGHVNSELDWHCLLYRRYPQQRWWPKNILYCLLCGIVSALFAPDGRSRPASLSHREGGKFRPLPTLLLHLLQTSSSHGVGGRNSCSSLSPSLCSISPLRFPETLSVRTTTRNPPHSKQPNMEAITRATTLHSSQSVEHPSSVSPESRSPTSPLTLTSPLSLTSPELTSLYTNT